MASQNLLYQIANPKIADVYGEFAEGQKQQNALAEIARANQARTLYGQALGGDKNALAGLAGLSPELHNAAAAGAHKQYEFDQAKANESRLSAAAMLSQAQTPQQYALAIETLRGRGFQLEPGDDDFNNRDFVASKLSDPAEVLASMRKIKEAKAGKEIELDYDPRIAAAKKAAELPSALALEREKRKNTVAQQNKPPAGYRWRTDGNLEAIPGGAADVKLQKGYRADETKLAGAQSKAAIVIGKVDEALANVGLTTTGLVGSAMGLIPGRAAYDLENTIDTIRAVMSFKELADMRASSPTGGALGQVTVRELELLSAAIASLDKGQSEEQLVKNLEAVKTHYQNWLAAMNEAYSTGQAPRQGVAQREAEQESQDIEEPQAIEETRVIDGVTRVRIGNDWYEPE